MGFTLLCSTGAKLWEITGFIASSITSTPLEIVG
jgi:hypothetical protein